MGFGRFRRHDLQPLIPSVYFCLKDAVIPVFVFFIQRFQFLLFVNAGKIKDFAPAQFLPVRHPARSGISSSALQKACHARRAQRRHIGKLFPALQIGIDNGIHALCCQILQYLPDLGPKKILEAGGSVPAVHQGRAIVNHQGDIRPQPCRNFAGRQIGPGCGIGEQHAPLHQSVNGPIGVFRSPGITSQQSAVQVGYV